MKKKKLSPIKQKPNNQTITKNTSLVDMPFQGMIAGDKKFFLASMLILHLEGNLSHSFRKGITGLARYIAYNCPLTYTKRNKLTPLISRSIETELRNIHAMFKKDGEAIFFEENKVKIIYKIRT